MPQASCLCSVILRRDHGASDRRRFAVSVRPDGQCRSQGSRSPVHRSIVILVASQPLRSYTTVVAWSEHVHSNSNVDIDSQTNLGGSTVAHGIPGSDNDFDIALVVNYSLGVRVPTTLLENLSLRM